MWNITKSIFSSPKNLTWHISRAILKHFDATEREFQEIWTNINSIDGFLVSPYQEHWLFKAAKSLPEDSTIVEIGSFKGRSTSCLAYGCKRTRKHLYAIDLFDANDATSDYYAGGSFFEEFLQNIEKCGLANYVTPIKQLSSQVSKTWDKTIHLLFIDGSHSYVDVLSDFYGFYPHVAKGGIIAVHDIIEVYPGCLRAWKTDIKARLNSVGYCKTLGFGVKP